MPTAQWGAKGEEAKGGQGEEGMGAAELTGHIPHIKQPDCLLVIQGLPLNEF